MTAHKTKTQRNNGSLHPLDVLLKKAGGEGESTLEFWARWVSGEWDSKSSAHFRKGIRTKIKLLKYEAPSSKSGKKTFERILEDASALQRFLSPHVLTTIEKWFLLNEVLRLERKYRSEKKMTSGYPVQFHRSLLTELQRHYGAIDRITRKYNTKYGIMNYGPMVFREILRQFKLLLPYRRPQSWRELLGEADLPFSPRDEEVAIKVGAFRYLKMVLAGEGEVKATLSDQFLRELALLVMARADATRLHGADALRQAIEKRNRAGKKSRKSSKNS